MGMPVVYIQNVKRKNDDCRQLYHKETEMEQPPPQKIAVAGIKRRQCRQEKREDRREIIIPRQTQNPSLVPPDMLFFEVFERVMRIQDKP